MPRLVWGTPGNRYYETGVDRGVVYIGVEAGVAWPGLISVTEAPTGGSPKPRYIDGIKYLNLASAEEFEATIEAFGTPREFGACDGTVEIHNGLYATQQRRVSFGLSYRTFVGNDTTGPESAYKIHLVYGALVSPSDRSYTTDSDTREPLRISLAVSTLPPFVSGIRRTSHYVVDSRYADSGVLTTLEDLLYGNESQYASMPTPNDLISLFA